MNRTLMVVGALAVFALSLLIVACGSDPAPTAPTALAAPVTEAPPTAPPTETSPPATPRPAPTSAPATATPPATTAAPTPPPTPAAPTPAPTPEEPEELDATDAFFAMERVLEVSIEIAPEDWDTLRHQTRTFEDLMAEIEKYNLSQPFADIYDWFSATVTIDGETHTEVGVRKKGFLGSQSDTKPSLKLRFDKYVDGQALGGVIERMTLNNSKQDVSMVNTCLAYQVFAAAGLPASRCNFATVTVNGKDLGLYVHVEEIKIPMLARHFDSAEGNLYEGNISDFTPQYRGTIEKKTNEDADDWSDVDAVVAALQDPSDAGLKALGKAVDLDRFLTFWATEVLVGHWDGYTGDRNNYHFYREPGGPFVFIPWGVDDVFHLKDDPNPFDEISDPPPSVLALSAIPNRLYNNPEWRLKYAERLKYLLESVWLEDDLLDSVDRMAAIVQEHSLPEVKAKAAEDTERVRKFILKRKGEILADITPEPPDWPEPSGGQALGWEGRFSGGEVELSFKTAWGSNQSADPFATGGKVTGFSVNGIDAPIALQGLTAVVGPASAEEAAGFDVENAVSLSMIGLLEDGSVEVLLIVLPMEQVADGAAPVIGEGAEGIALHIPAGSFEPDQFIPIAGFVEFAEANTEAGAAVSGSVYVSIGFDGMLDSDDTADSGTLETRFATTWGSNKSVNPIGEGEISYLSLNGAEQSFDLGGIIAGYAGPDEAALMPDVDNLAALTAMVLQPDGSVGGMTLVMPADKLADGVTLVIGQEAIAGGVWTLPAGAAAPDDFTPFTEGTLELSAAGTEDGAAIRGSFSGAFGGSLAVSINGELSPGMPEPTDIGLVINEIAAKGDPMDWFELHNNSLGPIGLFALTVADDLDDAGKRVAFPPGTEITPGEYLQFEVDSDNWAGFKLGGDEELGIWLADGTLVAMVDWNEGDSGEGESYARIPDATGDFQTVSNPTPGAANQAQ